MNCDGCRQRTQRYQRQRRPRAGGKGQGITAVDNFGTGSTGRAIALQRCSNIFFCLYRHATFFDLVIVAVSTVCAVVAGAVVPVAPIVTAEIFLDFSKVEANNDDLGPTINHFTLWYVYFTIITLVTWVAATASFIHTGAKKQNMAVFDDTGTGEILSHLTADANLIQDALSLKLALTVNAFGQLVATIIMCFALDWVLTFITFWASILGCVIVYIGGVATIRYNTRTLDALSAGTAIVEESLGSIKGTTALCMQKHVHRIYMDCLAKAAKHGFVLKALNSSMMGICVAASYINIALAFWQGSRRFTEGEVSFTHVVAFTIITKSAAFCVLSVGGNMEAFTLGVAAARRLFPMTYRVSPIDSSSDQGNTPDHLDGKIQFRNVKHVYPIRPTVTVLDDVSLTFPAGETTAIVGPSGSGKISIANLILRFYDPLAGEILLDDADLTTFQLRWLRQQVHVVSQEPFLFNKSVYENIEYGFKGTKWDDRLNEKRNLIHEAAKMAQAHDFIMKLPMGYGTIVGTRGSRLSGGQAQRVAIARALIAQPRILLLDEATSALDSETEAKVLAAMNEKLQNCTKIVTAHRLSAIRDANKIVVLKNGHIVESGTHTDLMASQSTYHDLVQAQDMSHDDHPSTDDENDGLNEKTELALDIHNFESQAGNKGTLLGSEEVDAKAGSSSLFSLLKFGLQLNKPE